MRILHIISQAPDFTGSGKFIQQILIQSAEAGYENFLVAGVQGDFILPEGLIEQSHCCFVRFDGKDLNFPIPGMSDVMPYESRVFSRMIPQEMAAYEQVFETKIRQALERFAPDIIHSHHLWIVSAIARRLSSGIPMVTSCHGTCLRQHVLCPAISKKIIPGLKQIDHVIALSRSQKQEIVRTIGIESQSIHVVSGGYNDACFFHAPKTFDGVVELVYAGKLSHAKGVPWLLNSLAKIRHLPFRLHLAGNSSDREKARCLELAGVLTEKVIYHGPLSHDALGNLLRNAHVFVLPSFYEGLPLVLMEALACGCRLVATALPGVKELLADDDSPMVRLLDLPPLQTIDTPYDTDIPDLEARLADVLEQTIRKVQSEPDPDWDYACTKTFPYTWEKIFSKIDRIYRQAPRAASRIFR
ncbi:MAG: glycosyltransferase family 4 protein [Desulfotignum sp.]